jgi:hypothetical protein
MRLRKLETNSVMNRLESVPKNVQPTTLDFSARSSHYS